VSDRELDMMPMGLLAEGEAAEIVGVRPETAGGERRRIDARVEDMGLRAGCRVEMLSNGGGAVVVKVDASRVAVARALAMTIVVRRS
jgi:ferrous iron transport protein A